MIASGEHNRARRKTDNEIWDYINELEAEKKRLLKRHSIKEYRGRELDQINSLIYALKWTIGNVTDPRTGEYL